MSETKNWANFLRRYCYLSGMPVIVTSGIIDPAPAGPDHNSITVALFVIGIIISFIGTMMWAWFRNVNESLKDLNAHLREESRAREERWEALHRQCNHHGSRISRLEGRLSINPDAAALFKLEDQ